MTAQWSFLKLPRCTVTTIFKTTIPLLHSVCNCRTEKASTSQFLNERPWSPPAPFSNWLRVGHMILSSSRLPPGASANERREEEVDEEAGVNSLNSPLLIAIPHLSTELSENTQHKVCNKVSISSWQLVYFLNSVVWIQRFSISKMLWHQDIRSDGLEYLITDTALNEEKEIWTFPPKTKLL